MSAAAAPTVIKRRHVYNRDYYLANSERLKAYQREYSAKHPERCKAAHKAYRLANIDRMRAQNRAYHADNAFTYWAKSILRKFGVTAVWYIETLKAQGGGCAICGGKGRCLDYRTGRLRRLPVDHNHTTGKTRGILCHRCNLMVGHMEERADWLRKAADYLQQYEGGGR